MTELFEYSSGFHRGACDKLTLGYTAEKYGPYTPQTPLAKLGQDHGDFVSSAIFFLAPIGRANLIRTGGVVSGRMALKEIVKEAEKEVEKNLLKKALKVAKNTQKSQNDQGSRKRFKPDPKAEGAHVVFRRDPLTNKVTHYEEYKPQSNPFDPKPWESVKRYDGTSKSEDGHFNYVLEKYIPTPHVHDKNCPGGIRPAELWEIPK